MPRTDSARKRASARLRRNHAARIASGLCTRCGKAPPEPGLKMCSDCGDKRRAADRARRAKARAEGKLYGGRDPDLCRRADRAGDRRRRRARRDAGLCSNCGRNPPEDGRTVCEPCREARRAIDRRRYAARRAAGACVRCSEPAVGGSSRCARHAALEAERVSPERKKALDRKRYARRRAQGRCTDCGVQVVGAARCPACRPAVQYPRACVSRCAGRAALLQRDRAGDPGGSRHLRDRGRSRCLPRLRGAAPRPGGNPLQRAAPRAHAHGLAAGMPPGESGRARRPDAQRRAGGGQGFRLPRAHKKTTHWSGEAGSRSPRSARRSMAAQARR